MAAAASLADGYLVHEASHGEMLCSSLALSLLRGRFCCAKTTAIKIKIKQVVVNTVLSYVVAVAISAKVDGYWRGMDISYDMIFCP